MRSRLPDEEAQKHAISDAGLAALGLVSDVVDLTCRRRLVTPPGPLTVVVPEDDRVADRGRDGLGVADIKRQARPAQPGAELTAAQEGGETARARQEVHRLADNRSLKCFQPRGGGGRGRGLRLAPSLVASALGA
jgi:hypothetical protein